MHMKIGGRISNADKDAGRFDPISPIFQDHNFHPNRTMKYSPKARQPGQAIPGVRSKSGQKLQPTA
jgi:hypothetical protein